MQVLIEGVPTSRQGSDWDMNKHGEHLPDPQSAASALILDRRIPPAGQMDDVISTRERQSYAAGSRHIIMNSPGAIFQRRLHDYGDLIAAMIHTLGTKC